MTYDQNVVSTKLMPPRYRGQIIDRPPLNPTIKQLPARSVTLICAAAGYGKSTLMAAWHKNLSRQHITACWLALDEEESNESALLSCLIDALTQPGAITGLEARSQLSNWSKSRASAVIHALIAELGERDQPAVLFLDDYHLADSTAVATIMESLINLAPDSFYLVIASRKKPEFSVGRLKAHNLLQEFDVNSLRFSHRDVEQFLKPQLGESLDRQSIAELTSLTEGWPAGLQLVALSLAGSDNYRDNLSRMSANIGDIADYLAKDVVEKLPGEIQQFLLRTAVPNRFNPDLCDVLNPGQNNRQLLDRCLQQNLFLIPLDEASGWYRYHHLFRDFLLNQLALRDGESPPHLHRQASQWFAAQGLIDAAVAHAIEASDYFFLMQLVETHARRFMQRGHMSQVLDWVNRIPAKLITDRPVIPMLKCWALFHMRRPAQATAAMTEAEQMIAALEQRGVQLPAALKQELTVLRCGIAVAADDVDAAMEFALREIPAVSDNFVRGVQQNILGYCYFAESRYQLAREALARGYSAHSECDSTYGRVYSHCFSALVEMAEGQLARAEQLFSQAEKTAELEESWRTYISAEPSLYRGCILYDWNQLDEARELIEQNLPYVEECAQAGAPIIGHIVMAQIHRREDNIAQAYRHLERAQDICRLAGLKHQHLLVADEQIRQLVLDRQIYRASASADLLGIHTPHGRATLPARWDREDCWKLLIGARLLIAGGEHAAAVAVIDQLAALAAAAGRPRPQIQLLLMKAGALLQLQQPGQAMSSLREAIEAAFIGPYFGPFHSEAPFLAELLKQAEKTDSLPQPCRQFLQGLSKPAYRPAPAAQSRQPENRLSDREAEILRLISQGKTNQQISAQLFIAINTVKWHLKNIFEKLEVRNRTSAVFAAKELGIID